MGREFTDKRSIASKGVPPAVLAVPAGSLQLLADLPVWVESRLLLGVGVGPAEKRPLHIE